MTIIPKPSAIKKADKLEVPLVLNEGPIAGRVADVESQSHVHIQQRAQKISNMTTCCLLLTALSVVGMGIIGGTFLYEQYMRVHLRNRINLNIPYRDEDFSELIKSRIVASEFNNQFPEELQIDNDVEMISVPDFKDGRDGRFIHDFNTNTTGIIDLTGDRCFVMPLNREAVLPPQSLYDLLQKMYSGYYAVDTNMVRHSMRVVTPPIDDPIILKSYIGRECDGKPIYRLEKFVSGVVKRSADQQVRTIKFTEFAGQVTQFDIVNYNELEAFEKANR